MKVDIKQMAGEHFSMMPPKDELEAFAKDIARFCAAICNTVSGDQVESNKDYQEGREMGAIVCRNQIHKYFL